MEEEEEREGLNTGVHNNISNWKLYGEAWIWGEASPFPPPALPYEMKP